MWLRRGQRTSIKERRAHPRRRTRATGDCSQRDCRANVGAIQNAIANTRGKFDTRANQNTRAAAHGNAARKHGHAKAQHVANAGGNGHPHPPTRYVYTKARADHRARANGDTRSRRAGVHARDGLAAAG